MVQHPLGVGHGNVVKVQQQCDKYGLREAARRTMKLSQIQIAAQTDRVARIHKFKLVGQHLRRRAFPDLDWISHEACHG